MKTAEQVRSHIESGRDASFADQLGVTASVGVSALPARAQTTHQLSRVGRQGPVSRQGPRTATGWSVTKPIPISGSPPSRRLPVRKPTLRLSLSSMMSPVSIRHQSSRSR